jgi:hypothetical protein
LRGASPQFLRPLSDVSAWATELHTS